MTWELPFWDREATAPLQRGLRLQRWSSKGPLETIGSNAHRMCGKGTPRGTVDLFKVTQLGGVKTRPGPWLLGSLPCFVVFVLIPRNGPAVPPEVGIHLEPSLSQLSGRGN